MTVAFRFTSADLERMPEIAGVRYEIIDGELYVSRAPTEAHQYASGVLFYALHGWNLQTGLGIALLAPGLVFSDDNDVIPDLIWISHQRRRESVDAKGHFALAPELVVEVLSPGTVNRVRDRDAKLALYSRQQVQDYWIVDPDSRLVEIYRQSGASGLVLSATLADGDTITSPLLPGFTCPVASLWVPPLGE